MFNQYGQNVEVGGPATTEDIIKDLIETDQKSQRKREMVKGVKYYNTENDILARDFRKFYVGNVEYIDYNKSNEMIVNNLHKTLVDQKKGYIASKKITFKSDDDKLVQKINELLGEDFHDLVQEWIQNASNKGAESMQPFINEDGEFDYVLVPEERVIYIKDTSHDKKVIQAIVYYAMEVIQDGEITYSIRVEIWDKEKVTRYQETKESDGSSHYTFIQPGTWGVDVNPRYHWYDYNTNFVDKSQLTAFGGVQPDGFEAGGWGRVPMIQLKNNTEARSDLIPYKRYVDALDIVSSGFVNDLKDVQLAIWVLRGYEGEDLADFMLNLQKFKAIKLEENGSAEPKTLDIPKEARIAMMEWLNKKIYEIGQGVDVTKLTGGSITNVVIQAMYGGLESKADQLITKLRVSLSEFMFFVVQFINDRDNTTYDYKDIEFVFNKTMIFNIKEIVEYLVLVSSKISDRTFLANLPFVDDVDAEILQIKKEKEERANSMDADDRFGEDDDE